MVAQISIGGVRTTGIYCREGCPARPKRRNVVEFTSAVAAEAAGYRPCLRCRPDRLPPSYGADGAPPIIERALLLISEGTLDDEREDGIARQLRVSGRHLRRLFLEHIGATPALVARSRRAHFARRLLDETDLSVADIAFAAGFSSVRQMNRVVREVFRLSPSQLRAKRMRGDRLVADGGLPLRVPYHGLFSFSSALGFLRPRAIPGVEAGDGASYRRTITTCGNPGVIDITDAGDGRHLIIVAHLPTVDALIDDVARVRRIFGLDLPVASWLPALMRDPLLAPLADARPGLRPLGAWDRFEVAVRIIIGQGVSVAGASTLAGRLVEALGEPVPGIESLGVCRTFPPAERIAETRVDRLAATGLPKARALAVRALARAYLDGTVALDPPSTLDTIVAQLTALPGIGPWTGHFVALRAAGQLDAFPAEDLGLRRAMGRLLGRESNALVSPAELSERAERWRPYRGVAAMHLWAGRPHP